MSEADKMFEELGYKKIKNQFIDVIELWGNDDDKRLSFETDKTICMYDFFGGTRNITIQELKAINKKVEEFKWN
jgi:hypothetical protein